MRSKLAAWRLRLVNRHLPLVYALARDIGRSLGGRFDTRDLIGYGSVGLLEAAHRFDASLGWQFSTYAHHRIRGAIFDGVREMSALPRKAHAAATASTPSRPPVLRVVHLDDVDVAGDEPTPEDALARQQLAARARSAIRALPARERACVVGHYFRGESLGEVGDTRERSKSWASRVHTRAISRLRAVVAPERRAA